MKKIILTIDYELYLGDKTGSVKECMIEPTDRLLDILDINDSKMTVFWDILHFYKLLELQDKFPELKKDRIAIQDQIHKMVRKGHDIQLHLHPHWLDAKYLNKKWKFIYNRFKLHSLSKLDNPEDINTVLGCITISKNLMEEIVKMEDKHYKVTSFRAGGYLIEPFDEILETFYKNDIYIDSSVVPDLKNDHNVYAFNYKNYPRELIYKFDRYISKIDNSGNFTEIPITTYKIPLLRRLYFTLLKRFKYKNFSNGRKGTGSESSNKKKLKKTKKILSYIYDKQYDKLTTDDSFREKYNYLLSRTKNYSTQILHSKMLNEHACSMLESNLVRNRIKFVSIDSFVKEKYSNQVKT
jgi:hypothetical protein